MHSFKIKFLVLFVAIFASSYKSEAQVEVPNPTFPFWKVQGNSNTNTGTNFIGTTDNFSLAFRTNNIQRVVIDSFGRVGIQNANPIAPLDVAQTNGSSNFTIVTTNYNNPNDVLLSRAQGNIAAPTIIGSGGGGIYSRLIARGYDGAFFRTAAQIAFEVDGVTSAGDMPGKITLFTTPDGTFTAQERMTIKNNGNIGIGEPAPLRILHIGGTINTVRITGLSTAGAFVNNPAATTDKLMFSDANGDLRAFPNGTSGQTLGINGAGVPEWSSTISNDWSLAGNGSTNAAINFLGTTDDQDLVFRRFNARAGLLNPKNTSFGLSAFPANVTGEFNTAFGVSALAASVDGFSNTAIGYEAMFTTTNSLGNTAVGHQALYFNTSGATNTAVGYQALYRNTEASDNTAVGRFALFNNTLGTRNTANGSYALAGTTTTSDNTAVGYGTLFSNTGGDGNTAVGTTALTVNNTGDYNTAMGIFSMGKNTSGSTNTSVGGYSMQNLDGGQANVAMGYDAGGQLTTGSYNIAVGDNAGPMAGFGTVDNTVTLGYNQPNNFSNQVIIGNASSATIGGFQNWFNYSDSRIKKNVLENVPGLAFILRLRPVTYYRSVDAANQILGAEDPEKKSKHYYAIEKTRYTGFIAQEVEAAAKSIGYDFSGVKPAQNSNDLYSVSYAEFVVPLVKAIQELQHQMEQLKKDNEALLKALSTSKQ